MTTIFDQLAYILVSWSNGQNHEGQIFDTAMVKLLTLTMSKIKLFKGHFQDI